MDGKTVLITGASGGIGRAVALRFARLGAKTVLHANRHPERAIATLREIEQFGGESAFLSADLSNSNRQVDFIEGVLSMFPRIDVIVNAAGLDLMQPDIRKLSFDERLELLFAVDVQATVRISRTIGKWMQKTLPPERGSIIMFGWDATVRGMEGETAELYSLAKGAIESYTKSLAQSLAPDIRVNVIAPGWIATGWGKNAPEKFRKRGERESLSGRWGTPDDIAAAAVFLASGKSSFINAQRIELNGGFRIGENY